MSCRSGLWPAESSCGHGTCVESVCVCDDGWTGYDDFAGAPYQDCNTNLIAMSILWMLVFIITFTNSILNVVIIYRLSPRCWFC